MSNRTIGQEIKYQYQFGGMHIKLIAINVVIFIAISLISVFGRLSGHDFEVQSFLNDAFTLQTTPSEFIWKPWGLLTNIFAHFSFLHLLMNMIVLYFAGNLFRNFFSDRRLLLVYWSGGIVGGLFELLAHFLFPAALGLNVLVLGASGAVMALLCAVAFYRPATTVYFFGMIKIPIIFIVGLYVLQDLLSLGKNDLTAHFAHIGGAFLGFLAIFNVHSSNNVINKLEILTQNIARLFSGKSVRQPKMKVQRGGQRIKTDEEYNQEAKEKQERINKILDKISKSGYESLSKTEKDFLFSQSKK